MEHITALIMGADLSETLCNIVAMVFVIEFVGVVFALISNITKR